MESVFRAVALYGFLWIVFRLLGKRSVAQITMFDFIVLLLISQASQQAILGPDYSITRAFLVITTLLVVDFGIQIMGDRVPVLSKWVSGVPVVLVENGEPLEHNMRKARVSLDDVLENARMSQGLENMNQIKFAVLERSGSISVIPKQSK